MSQQENLLDLVSAIYRNRKPIILVTIVAAVISALVALMLPNYYQATTTFYAASPDLADPLPIGNMETNKSIYGTDTDMDRLFSIGQSGSLSEYIIEKFDLVTRYEIDPSDPKASYQVNLKLSKLYNFNKNKFDALELSIEDKDREVAANMANEARDQINILAQEIVKGSQEKVLEKYKSTIDSKEKNIKIIVDSLQKMKTKYEIFNASSQGKTYGDQIAKTRGQFLKAQSKLEIYKNDPILKDSLAKIRASISGYDQELKYLDERTAKYTSGVGSINKLERMASEQSGQLAIDMERYQQLKSAYEAPFSALHVVQEAKIPLIKSRPIRSLIVLGTTLLTFFLMLIWTVFMHQYRTVNWKSVFSDEKRD